MYIYIFVNIPEFFLDFFFFILLKVFQIFYIEKRLSHFLVVWVNKEYIFLMLQVVTTKHKNLHINYINIHIYMRGTSESAPEYSLLLQKPPTVNKTF